MSSITARDTSVERDIEKGGGIGIKGQQRTNGRNEGSIPSLLPLHSGALGLPVRVSVVVTSALNAEKRRIELVLDQRRLTDLVKGV
ncbi:hypothetical protein WUBG_02080 [Wuchereria bancrofti]|uniref:Uncharacterized protein n=1 Tax=Wuchereria bancrofti TaxID=6293 RepID=J9BI24_WUCBA|nr:hypothetical protein WUBG_02080 [Wuchereria bancrofti]VDM19260.1 unnamed protein product [Wuchereria bancrofti]